LSDPSYCVGCGWSSIVVSLYIVTGGFCTIPFVSTTPVADVVNDELKIATRKPRAVTQVDGPVRVGQYILCTMAGHNLGGSG
jgi:hypothetical protein